MTLPNLDEIRTGMIILVDDDNASPLPLEKTSVAAQILGPAVAVAVTQHFANPFEQPAEFEYLFPLPENAAVTDFDIRIGARIIRAELKEVEEARHDYEEARRQGKRGGLLESRRPNLFAVRLANVLPGESIQATVRYQQRLKFSDGSYEFVFPMGITPRYHSPADKPEKHSIDAPVTQDLEGVGTVEISLSADAGTAVGEPTSPSHPLAVTRLDERRFSVQFGERAIPDHDFVLRYGLASAQPVLAAWLAGDAQERYFLATLVPPALDDSARQTGERVFVFVLDRSGSMSGEPIAQARNALRACLRALNPGDGFNILLFDDRLEWYRKAIVTVDQAAIDQADRYLDGVEGRGGTEIVPALEAALKSVEKTSAIPYIIFLTDGAVAGEERAIGVLRAHIGRARIFTFGVGPSVNRALLNDLARLGRGTAEFLQLRENIEETIIRFQDRIGFPLLTDLALSADSSLLADLLPQPLPDLYAGQPVEVVGRVTGRSKKALWLKLSGKRAGQSVDLQASLPAEPDADPLVRRLWAEAQIQALMERMSAAHGADDALRKQIIALALKHRLATAFTAFVAVDEAIANAGGKTVYTRVSHPLPAGLDYEGFFGEPQVQYMGIMPRAMASGAGSRRMAKYMGSQLPSTDDLDLPSFLRRPSSLVDKSESAEINDMSDVEPLMNIALPGVDHDKTEDTLRYLARNQRLDGSWDGEVELTATALLLFARAGYSERKGHYRRQLSRAIEWLLQAKAGGFAMLAQAAALGELAALSGDARCAQAAALLRAALAPEDLALLDGTATPPDAIRAADGLRRAALLRAKTARLEYAPQNDLERTWLALLEQG